MKLEPNNDNEPLPGIGAEPKEWIPETEIEKWAASFPYENADKPFELNLRCGEKREINGIIEYRRLRIRIQMCDWVELLTT